MRRTIPSQSQVRQRQTWDDRTIVAALQAACRMGLRRQSALIPILASYARAHPGRFPYPSQVTLAARLGVHRMTITRWLGDLERHGLIAVWRSCARPTGPDGELTRRTNRYLLLTKGALVQACPLPRRRSHLRSSGATRPLVGGPVPPPPTSTELPWALPPAPQDHRARVQGLRDALWPPLRR